MAVTIKDIARLSGYGVGTVSRVLNGSINVSEAARKRIEAVVREQNFNLNTNAKHLRQQAPSGIAVIVKGTQNMLFAAVMERLQGMIREKGFACLVYYIDEDENEVQQALRICRERHPQGVLFLGSNLDAFRQDFAAITIPCVLVTNSAAGLGFDKLSSVSTDDAAGAQTAVEHLIKLGHRSIGILGGKMESSKAAATRFIGCRRAFEKHRIPFDREKQMVTARFTLESGYQAMNELLGKEPGITAVFAMSDVMAMGAIRAIHDRGLRVPEDISVIGYDGIDMARFVKPKLTTVRQDREKLAMRSVEILLDNIRGKETAVHEVTPFKLLTGESVKEI